MNKNIIETLIGALVLSVAIWFISVFAYEASDVRIFRDDYLLKAKFESIDGVTVGSAVRIGGVKIGVVTNQFLEPQTYLAVIEFSINKDIKVPKDSTATIVSDGLIGTKYVSITPGSDDTMIANNGEVQFTQSSVNLETLLGKMMFNK